MASVVSYTKAGLDALINTLNQSVNATVSQLNNSFTTLQQGVSMALSEKAPLSHTHTLAEVTSLQTTLNGKASLNSPTFMGTVAVPTPVDATAAANKSFVETSIATALDGFEGGVSLPFEPTTAEIAAMPVGTYYTESI